MLGSFIGPLVIDPTNTAILYAAGGEGVYKSTNGGMSWKLRNKGLLTTPTALAIDPTAPNTLYAGTYKGGGVFKTTDGGKNWRPANNGLNQAFTVALEVDLNDSNNLYISDISGGVHKSNNRGESFKPANEGLLNPPTLLTVDPGDSQTVYAVIPTDAEVIAQLKQANVPYSGVFKSTNGGKKWDDVNKGLPTFDPQSGNKIETTLPRVAVSKIVIDPLAPMVLYSMFHFNPSSFLDPNTVDPNTLLIHKSTNGGLTWTVLPTIGLPSQNVLFIDLTISPTNSILYASYDLINFNGTSDAISSLYKSFDGGNTWFPTGLPRLFPQEQIEIDPIDSSILYAIGDELIPTNGTGAIIEKKIQKSTDGGVTWNPVSGRGLPRDLRLEHLSRGLIGLRVDSATPSALYVFGSEGVFISIDGGESFASFSDGLSGPSRIVGDLKIDPQNPNRLYAVTAGNGVYVYEKQ